MAIIVSASMAEARSATAGALQTTATVIRSLASSEMALPSQASLVIRASNDAVVVADRGIKLAYDRAQSVYVATSLEAAGHAYVTVTYP